MSQRAHRTLRPKARGLGMVELLMSLAIMAMLLTSVAAAFHASLKTVEQNQKVSTVTHNARIVLNRMMAEIRQADAVECEAKLIRLVPPTFGALTLTEYELDGNTLWYHQTIDGKRTSHAILTPEDGVTINNFQVYFEQAVGHDDAGDDFFYTRRVTSELDVEVAGSRFAVTASTNPRRNLQW